MKTQTISSFIAALAASITIQASGATLDQALSFDLSGNAAGTPTTFGNIKETPDIGVRITTKDVIALIATNSTSDLRSARLLILSQFGPGTVATNTSTVLSSNVVTVVVTNGTTVTTNFTLTVTTNTTSTIVTNREATDVVIRGIKGRTNDLDVTRFFKFETLTNDPIARTGRFNTNTHADLGSKTFELARIVIQNGTNAPLLEIRGYKTVSARTSTVNLGPSAHHGHDAVNNSVTGLLRSWDLDSATGVGRSELGAVSVYGGADATATGVEP